MWNVSLADRTLWLFVSGRPMHAWDEPTDGIEPRGQGQGKDKTGIGEKSKEQRDYTLLGKCGVLPRVFELPALLYLRTAFSAETATVPTENLDGLEHDNVGGLHSFLVFAHTSFIVQL